MRNGERGAAFGIDFYTAGTKMFPVPVPGTAFLERGTHPRSTNPVTMLTTSNLSWSYYLEPCQIELYYKFYLYLFLKQVRFHLKVWSVWFGLSCVIDR